MNIQDEMDRIFKMQKENQGQLFIDAERKSSKMRNAIYIVYAVNLKQLARMGTHILQEAHDVLVMENNRAGFYLMGNCLLHFSY
jgi:hypothetical protein